jgi:uncharacterized membrane protein
MNALRAGTLLAATVTMGLMAGMFGLYSHTIMPGLGTTDDRTFVGAFQAIDAPDQIADLAAVRASFDEARWSSWNLVRAVATTTAFGLLAWALVVYGRST